MTAAKTISRAVVAAAVLTLPASAGAADLSGASRVIDGDSLEVDGIRVRLLGIDAPELGEPGAVEAKSEWSASSLAARGGVHRQRRALARAGRHDVPSAHAISLADRPPRGH